MALRRLQVTDFRCLQSVTLEFDRKFTLISGPNASGKTSLLEAIFVLGRGRSFRTRRIEQLVRRGADRFIAFGEVDATPSGVALGIEGSQRGIQARIGGASARSLLELAIALPVQIIDPEVHQLIEDGPFRRRRYLDWGVFHVEPGFIGSWQRYQQVLKQRNAALKRNRPRAEISAWDRDLVASGEDVSAARARYVDALLAPAQWLVRRFLGQELELVYRPGWAAGLKLEDALSQTMAIERERGVTLVGPHRAELKVRVDGIDAKDHISRGQQKLLAAALLLAQLRVFPSDAAVLPTLLLDDPAAELDQEHLSLLIDEVSRHPNQLVVTTLQPEFEAFGVPGIRIGLCDGKSRIT